LEQFGIRLPEKFAQAPVSLSESMAITVTGGYGNFPAALVTLALTGLLALGIRESAGFNTGVSLIKIAVILAVVAVGIF
jgi:APA family basic amino acid/polyamine antiporter